MKLYVTNQSTGEKRYLKQSAVSRQELVKQLGSERFQIDQQVYSVSEVVAESNESTAGAMAAGGVIGVVGGVPGVIIGGIIGALLGKSTDDEDKVKTDKFNGSEV
ncbi:hypothetical protein [Pseudoalteromonas sp. H105]|uniref:hypothetical protein n=1 Tax=Pseudoalteromonas sp. H105 TaxID=1348393 RepID=UPI000731F193|nr:hypothetical protein [Pseudoalteromonas sp. H105]KTF17023.1 hypothetical protein ATS75_06165 [Pseudoalteromonas sp. H105]